MSDKHLDVGDLVTHKYFGDGQIDSRYERGGFWYCHVHFAKVSASIPVGDLKAIAPDEPDAQAVAHLEAVEAERYGGA